LNMSGRDGDGLSSPTNDNVSRITRILIRSWLGLDFELPTTVAFQIGGGKTLYLKCTLACKH
jgi:hypothetical protein